MQRAGALKRTGTLHRAGALKRAGTLKRAATLLGTGPLLGAGLRLLGITAGRRHRALNRRCVLLRAGRLRLGDFGTNLRLCTDRPKQDGHRN